MSTINLNGVFVDISEFIYTYASSYHHNHVKCVLAIENWKDVDCDVKYARYLQEYIKCKETLIEKTKNEAEVVLKEYSKKRSTEAYNFIFRNLIDELRNNYTVTDEEYDEIKSQLDSSIEENFNFEYLKRAREIEEKFYQEKFRG